MTDPFPNLDLSCLTPRQREVIEMRYYCCLSWGQIALFLNLSIRSVRTHHDRAIDVLEESLSHSAPYKVDA